MKLSKSILPLLFSIVILTISASAGAESYKEARNDAYGNSSDAFDNYVNAVDGIEANSSESQTSDDTVDDYSGLMARFESESGRDPLGAILERYPVTDRETLDELKSWDESTVKEKLSGDLDEDLILGLILTRSPRLARAENNWRASINRYPQTMFLQDLLDGYRSISGGMSLGLGREYQNSMIQMSYPSPGMLSLRGSVVELDIGIAWNEYLTEASAVIAEAKSLLAEIRNSDEMISINSASVSRLSVLNSVIYAQYVSGTQSFSDLIRIRTELASRQDTLEQMKTMRSSQLGSLASMLNMSPDTGFGDFSWADGSDFDPDIDTLLADIGRTNPDITAMSLGVKKMDTMIEMTLKDADMDPTFGMTYFQGTNPNALSSGSASMAVEMPAIGPAASADGMDMGSTPSPAASSMESDTSSGMDAGMDTMDFPNGPMFDHRDFNYPLDLSWAVELRDQRSAMQSMLEAETDMMSGMLNMQVEKYIQSMESAGVSRGRIIPNSQSALDVIRSGYTTDANDFNDLIMAELDLLMAKMDLANYVRDARIALAEIEKISGHAAGVGGINAVISESE